MNNIIRKEENSTLKDEMYSNIFQNNDVKGIRHRLYKTIFSFEKLEKNWGSYDEDEIDPLSIIVAIGYINMIPDIAIPFTSVYPMRDGGVQVDIGKYKEVEIHGTYINEVNYDYNCNVINQFRYRVY